jgi:putative ATPase
VNALNASACSFEATKILATKLKTNNRLNMVECPICGKPVKPKDINNHIDSACESFIDEGSTPPLQNGTSTQNPSVTQKSSVSAFFQTPSAKRAAAYPTPKVEPSPILSFNPRQKNGSSSGIPSQPQRKRSFEDVTAPPVKQEVESVKEEVIDEPAAKKAKTNAFQKAAPLAERMRPRTLDDVYGQELVGPNGVLRGLIEQGRLPSIILWGGAGTGKTTIARCIASMVGSRFVEINSTSSGVAECKKIFAEARGELGLTGRKTIIFCDEIHRFSKSQQDVFLGPVESGQITLIGATTENPSFKGSSFSYPGSFHVPMLIVQFSPKRFTLTMSDLHASKVDGRRYPTNSRKSLVN